MQLGCAFLISEHVCKSEIFLTINQTRQVLSIKKPRITSQTQTNTLWTHHDGACMSQAPKHQPNVQGPVKEQHFKHNSLEKLLATGGCLRLNKYHRIGPERCTVLRKE
ncbi:hypothetical protein GOODEAATRI_022515 [Goodea atripinnis]|uniref:Uncharacterized protein n=1 Tax=Goodea atripinnis TaxID=208336 RepID=A0ABV0PG70_9TELE